MPDEPTKVSDVTKWTKADAERRDYLVERDRFETWCCETSIDIPVSLAIFRRDKNGQYVGPVTQCAWVAWQASAKLERDK